MLHCFSFYRKRKVAAAQRPVRHKCTLKRPSGYWFIQLAIPDWQIVHLEITIGGTKPPRREYVGLLCCFSYDTLISINDRYPPSEVVEGRRAKNFVVTIYHL